MRAFRPLSIAAISALGLAAGPALAQQAAALPPLAGAAAAGADYAGASTQLAHNDDHGDRHWNEGPGWDGPPPPPASDDGPPRWHGRHDGDDGHGPGPRMGYSPEQRDGWLEECADRLGGEHGHDGRARHDCEVYLHDYEARYDGGHYGGHYGGQWAYGPGDARPVGPGCSSVCGYPMAAGPVMWVPVVLPAQNCCCRPKHKVRTIVTYETVPEKVVTYERVPTKVVRTKYTKTVPVRTTKPIKSIK